LTAESFKQNRTSIQKRIDLPKFNSKTKMKKLEELQPSLIGKHQRDQRGERGQQGHQVEGVVTCQTNQTNQESHRGRNLVFRIKIFHIHQINNNSILSDKLKTLILISNE
jgi:hypothetical protein